MLPLLSHEPTVVGDYRLLARLGQGSMGAVYLGRSRGGRVVAVKVVRPDLAEDPQFRQRFHREVEMARAVGGFWTAAVVDADPDGERPWLATEYVPGPNLHQAVVEHGPLPENTVRALTAGLAEALQAIHAAGLVHRDLKPGNVLLGPDGPRVIDFGISRAMTASSMTATGTFFGTPGFFSPEQTSGGEVGAPSDVFSLGAVLVFAATAQGPFGDDHSAAMLYRVVHAEPDLSEVPDGLRSLLAGCLAKHPGSRPTPADLLDQVGEGRPQGSQWLPAEITQLITEHTTQLQRTAASPDPVEQAPSSGNKPPTRAYTASMPQQPMPSPPRRVEPGSVQQAPVVGASKTLPAMEPVVPKATKGTTQQPVEPPELVRKTNPGPVFATGGRIGALLSAVVMFALSGLAVAVAVRWTGRPAVDPRGFTLVVNFLNLIGALYLIKAILPPLRVMINSDGLRISRFGQNKQLPWSQLTRVGIVGHGKRQSLAVWVYDGPGPRTTWWHRVRRYHYGARVFPIGSAGAWWKRRREVKRMRVALSQYAPRHYDGRML